MQTGTCPRSGKFTKRPFKPLLRSIRGRWDLFWASGTIVCASHRVTGLTQNPAVKIAPPERFLNAASSPFFALYAVDGTCFCTMSFCLYSVLRSKTCKNPGRENSPPDCFLIRPSSPFERKPIK
jgi:hypothetical protein